MVDKFSSVQAFVFTDTNQSENRIILADFVITPPSRRTTGLIEDMQIVF